MSDLFSSYTYLGLTITLAAYLFGVWLRKKTGRSWCNPLLVACVLVIALLLLTYVPDISLAIPKLLGGYVSPIANPLGPVFIH